MKPLEGKVAVVTGGAAGIGRGYALALADAGADVVIADVDVAAGDEVAQEIRAMGRACEVHRTDVSDAESVAALAAATLERFDGVDIVVNNAAFFAGLPAQSLEELDEELWDRVMAVNVKGVWLVARAMLPLLRRRSGGVIVNQASTATYLASPRRMNYNASKAAVVAITKTLAKELGPEGVRVNAIAPGPTATAALQDVPADAIERAVQIQSIKRLGSPDDLAGALVFLASDASAWMTGQVVVVDGGGVMLG